MRSPISSEGIDVICVFSQYNAEATIIVASSATLTQPANVSASRLVEIESAPRGLFDHAFCNKGSQTLATWIEMNSHLTVVEFSLV
jgi:hypothetical protein